MKRRPRAPADAPASSRASPVPRSSRSLHWAGAGILAGAVGAAYFNSLHLPFQYDDGGAIAENVFIRRLWPLGDVLFPANDHVSGRPLLNLSYAINYALGGLDVVGYHVGNIVIHMLCAILLFRIVWLTIERAAADGALRPHAPGIALASALVWSLHPIQTGAVTYLSARSESLMALFYFLTIYAGILALRSPRGLQWSAVAVTACALGMACKESMATAPVVMVFYDRAFHFDSFKEAIRKRWRFYAALAVTWIVLILLLLPAPRSGSAGFSLGVSAWTYLLNQAVVLTDYLRVAFVPRRLIFAYGEPRPIGLPEAGPYAALVVALLGLTLWSWLKRPALGFAGVWFFATLAPTSSIVPIVTEAGAERRMYLPLAGLVTLVVVLLSALFEKYTKALSQRRAANLVGAALTGVVAVAFAALTLQRNALYASTEDLWRSTLDNWPSPLAHRNLATALWLAGKREEALTHLRQTVNEHPEVRYTIGIDLFELRRFDECIAELERFLQHDPHSGLALDARELIGRAWMAKGAPARAADSFTRILEAQPDRVAVQLGLADALFAQGVYKDAVPLYESSLKAYPDAVGVLTNLGIALGRTGETAGALRALRRAVEVAPDNEAARRNLAAALLSSGDIDAAVAHARQAVALRPDGPVGRELYGQALLAKGDYPQAIEQLERVLELDPSNVEVRQGLARLRQLHPPARR